MSIGTTAKVKIAIIGGGPGGYVAAIRAAQLGGDVTVIEKHKLGGTCLNVGCIPTKALLHAAELLEDASHNAAAFGLDIKVNKVDWNKVQTKKESIVNTLVSGVSGLMKMNKIKVVNAEASFINANTLLLKYLDGSVDKASFDKVIIAAGSVPSLPPIPGIENKSICIDSSAALSLSQIPSSLLIIGGGVIGIEMAGIYSTFGTKVTVVEALPNILPTMEQELVAQLHHKLAQSGVTIYTDAKVIKIESSATQAKTTISRQGKEESVITDKVLYAVGRKTDTLNLDLDKAGVNTDKGKILVNDEMQTNIAGIYAIGDCLGQVMLAHVASAQGEIAAENALGHHAKYDGKSVPSCVYTIPELAGVGLTEEACKKQNIDYVTGKFPLSANGKALIMNDGFGVVKVILDQRYKSLLGVHILGPRATDLIAEAALAIEMEATAEDLIATIHAHPTISEAIREGVLAAEGRAIHMPNKR
ncbi:dihydrolipoyl dehydrogenase [Zophobihabitans entericus]|uniref:Dihydrolipoyl dehydrogenase n=1 Tax=Zophobihabitans entericus TaxID=1635327 RepID=A0A6G9IA19_9GAMM|nr:dihydrolipoyl dehydrogenase [Zophobihabitans entericus]QIQ20574.1 dihydrolipoyl dehydrogenase [Zophobihabitans entericus]